MQIESRNRTVWTVHFVFQGILSQTNNCLIHVVCLCVGVKCIYTYVNTLEALCSDIHSDNMQYVCLSIQPLMVSVSAALSRMQCFESVTLQTPLTSLQDI